MADNDKEKENGLGLLKHLEDEFRDLQKKIEEKEAELEKDKKLITDLLNASDRKEQKIKQLQAEYDNKVAENEAFLEEQKALGDYIDYLQAQTELPPNFEGLYLRPDKPLTYQPPAEEGAPPGTPPPPPVKINRAWIYINNKAQSLTLGPGLKPEELKFGQLLRVIEVKGRPTVATEFIAKTAKEWPHARLDVEIIKLIDKDNTKQAIIDAAGGKPQIWPISELCEDKLESSDYVLVNREYQIIIGKAPQLEEEVDRKKLDPVTFKDVGGLNEQITAIKEVVVLPFKHPEYFENLGQRPPRSILFNGPPGTGKTLLARATANETDMFFLACSGSQFRSSFPGEDILQLKSLFKEAEQQAKKNDRGAIIFIDEFESLAPVRQDLHAGQHDIKAFVNFFLHLTEGLESRGKIIFMAATNNPGDIDEAARRRFDREIYIPVPTKEGRKEILEIHTRNMKLDSDINKDELVDKTQGFTGNDIEHLCIEAALLCKRAADEELQKLNLSKDLTAKDKLAKLLTVKQEHFLEILKTLRPSGTGDLVITDTGIKFKDVAGLHEVKGKLLREVQILLGKGGQLAARMGMKARKGILLIGWPGCGKTYIAKALATECGMNFIPVKGTQVRILWVGMSSRNLKEFFDKARRHAPCIIFLDEIDSMFPRRGTGIGGARVDEQLVTTFNEELDGIIALENVIVLAATNRPDLVDPAVIRRLTDGGEPVIIPALNKEDRKHCFEIHTQNKPLAKDVDFNVLADLTGERKIIIVFEDKTEINDFPLNGDEIRAICEEAARAALKEFEDKWGEQAEEKADECFIEQKHFLEIIDRKLERDRKKHEEHNDSDVGSVSEEELAQELDGPDKTEGADFDLDQSAIKKDFDETDSD